MKTINLETTDDRFLISIDRQFMDKSFLVQLIEKIRVEYLAKKLDVDEKVEDIGEEIKHTWWEKNKSKFID
jgi:hypothetical protein